MAKPDSWRLDIDNYPFQVSLDTRYQDLDVMGHVNNVALAGLFETGRIRFHNSLGRHPRDKGVRWLVAAVNLAFVDEAHLPDPIIIASGIGHIGNTSWHILSAAFQHGECVAVCDTVVVTHGAEGRRIIDPEVREMMQAHLAQPKQMAQS
ncbi:acyl-CoA thioesterase [Rhizorhapis sp. SPR117]|uniref:acyl-CoA thioesterase n=1 Tax=Rhizorhapis sp. SPR117 TaxID=2912611 RepID=UPI001F29C442|nr:acyl-CoA thioesterase [Rhizorhapis sp. SPR117]